MVECGSPIPGQHLLRVRVTRFCPTFQGTMKGLLKKAASGVLAIFPCSLLEVRSARKNDCGLAGRTFLNRPEASNMQRACGSIWPWKLVLFNTPMKAVGGGHPAQITRTHSESE